MPHKRSARCPSSSFSTCRRSDARPCTADSSTDDRVVTSRIGRHSRLRHIVPGAGRCCGGVRRCRTEMRRGSAPSEWLGSYRARNSADGPTCRHESGARHDRGNRRAGGRRRAHAPTLGPTMRGRQLRLETKHWIRAARKTLCCGRASVTTCRPAPDPVQSSIRPPPRPQPASRCISGPCRSPPRAPHALARHDPRPRRRRPCRDRH